jgi:hypothetical protein
LKEAYKNQASSGNYQSISDGNPLRDSQSQDIKMSSHERIDWSTTKSDVEENSIQMPGVVYVRRDFEIHTTEPIE